MTDSTQISRPQTPLPNADAHTVAGFGDEWSRFDQSDLSPNDHEAIFQSYFSVFPWDKLPANAEGFDAGCGSGRWALKVAPRVGKLHCLDASAEALTVAKRNLRSVANCVFHHASAEAPPIEPNSQDFGYSLGVLHHVPDTLSALRACVRLLKPGAPFLLYLYYAFDNRPTWFRALWQVSEVGRKTISSLPYPARYAVTQAIAAGVYLPLARTAAALERVGVDVDAFPLSLYRNRSFYVMRTDALDRFGTRLEKRYTRDEMRSLMESAGLERIRFREAMPYWCAVGYRSST